MAHVVGTSARRKEGPEKLTGHARYVDDYRIPGCLHGVTLRSTIARGRIRRVSLDPGFDWDEFVVATAADIPGQNVVSLIEQDQPLLADGEVRHALEPIALVAHADRARAYEALAHIEVEYEPLEAVLPPEKSGAGLQELPDRARRRRGGLRRGRRRGRGRVPFCRTRSRPTSRTTAPPAGSKPTGRWWCWPRCSAPTTCTRR